MILIHEAYTSPDAARAAELAHVRERNAAGGLFERIVPVSGGRSTFATLFALAADRFRGQVCIVANSDIVFDESLRLAEPLLCRPGRPTLVALTRWDDPAGPSMEGRVVADRWRFYSHSQDAWMFVAGGLPPFAADFTLGIPACENRLAHEAYRAGVAVVDPALAVRIWHHHASAVRSWKLADAYRGPLYFPRLTTHQVAAAEGLVIDRGGWRTRRREVRLEWAGAAGAADQNL